MNIFITGATGLIGTALLQKYSNLHSFITAAREEVHSVDALTEALKSQKFDAVIHLAGVRYSPQNDNFTYYIDNIKASEKLFSACEKSGVKNIICASSCGVYGNKNQIPWLETDTPCPNNFYGLSKLTMENTANLYNAKHGMNIKCLRIAQILSVDERKGFLLRTLFDNARQGVAQIIHGTGAGKREYIYIKDAADAIIKACENQEKKGIYNIGTGENISISNLAELINSVFENKAKTQFLKDKPEDLSISLMDCKKAEQELNFKPKFTLEKALYDIKIKFEQQ